MGVCLWGVLYVGVHGSSDLVVGEVMCELLVLLGACVTLGLTGSSCVSDSVLPSVVSLSGMEL
jgi:hypothetical protein